MRLLNTGTLHARGRRFAAGEYYDLDDDLARRLLREHPDSLHDISHVKTGDQQQQLAEEVGLALGIMVRDRGEVFVDPDGLEALLRSVDARREVCMSPKHRHPLGWNNGAYLEVTAPPTLWRGKRTTLAYWALAQPHDVRPMNDEERERMAGAFDTRIEVWLWPPLDEARRQTRRGSDRGEDVKAQGIRRHLHPRGERHLLPLPTRTKCHSCGAMSVIKAKGEVTPVITSYDRS